MIKDSAYCQLGFIEEIKLCSCPGKKNQVILELKLGYCVSVSALTPICTYNLTNVIVQNDTMLWNVAYFTIFPAETLNFRTTKPTNHAIV